MSYQMKHWLIKMFTVDADGLSRDQWIVVTFVGFAFGLILLLGSGTKKEF